MLYQLSHFRTIGPMKLATSGAEGQIRTDDTRLFRAVLYQLSYLGPLVDPGDGLLVVASGATLAYGERGGRPGVVGGEGLEPPTSSV